jgi:hypothetical protein
MAPVPIMLQSAFVENNSRLAGDGNLIYKTMDGIAGGALAYYPDGTSTHFAYQTFQAAIPIGSELQGTVEASEAGLLCSEATLELDKSGDWGYYYDVSRGDLDNTFVIFAHLRSETCHMDAKFGLKFDVSGAPTTVHLSRFLRGSCNGTNGSDGNRVGIISAIINYTVHDTRATNNYYASGNVDILRSTQVLCQPVFHIRQVDVIYNRTDEPRVNALAEAKTRTLEGVHPWDIMEAHFKSFWDNYDTIEAVSGFSVSVDGHRIDVDRYTELAYKSFVPSTTDISALFDQNFLIDTFNEYYKRYAAQIVHRTLLQTASIPSTGSASRAESRLVVDGLSCHLMAALLASVVFLICIILSTTNRRPELPYDPQSIVGIARLIRNSAATFSFLRNLGAANEKELLQSMRGRWYSVTLEDNDHLSITAIRTSAQETARSEVVPAQPEMDARFSSFQPIVLHPLVRILVIGVLAGMMAGMEVTLRQSQRNEGLASVREDGYQHYLWTTLPALLLGVVALFYAAVDFHVRTLGPFTKIARMVAFDQLANHELFGRQLPVIIFQELRSGNMTVIAATLAMLLTSLLSAFSGSLFQVLPVPSSTPTTLRTVNAFRCVVDGDLPLDGINSVGGTMENQLRYTPLILQSNMSYPPFTYEDLAFPAFSLVDAEPGAEDVPVA